jgi:hypothetical protein
MRRLLALVVLTSLAIPQVGCVVVPGRRSAAMGGPPRCHPSQYWDGTQCRHKGKGHGARKHDGWR